MIGPVVATTRRTASWNIQLAVLTNCSECYRFNPNRLWSVAVQKEAVPGSQGTLLPVHGAVANAPTRGAETHVVPYRPVEGADAAALAFKAECRAAKWPSRASAGVASIAAMISPVDSILRLVIELSPVQCNRPIEGPACGNTCAPLSIDQTHKSLTPTHRRVSSKRIMQRRPHGMELAALTFVPPALSHPCGSNGDHAHQSQMRSKHAGCDCTSKKRAAPNQTTTLWRT